MTTTIVPDTMLSPEPLTTEALIDSFIYLVYTESYGPASSILATLLVTNWQAARDALRALLPQQRGALAPSYIAHLAAATSIRWSVPETMHSWDLLIEAMPWEDDAAGMAVTR